MLKGKRTSRTAGAHGREGIVGGGVARTLAWVGRRHLPQTSGKLTLAGLAAPVEVLRDRWGVPHIYAAGLEDLFFAQGYVHAQERLWQMDFQRRLVAGRLAEVLGKLALPVDRWMRILGLRRAAEGETGMCNAEELAVLNAYAAGVNAFIAARRLPVEFTLLRYQPEPWGILDSIGWVKMLHWALSVNWDSELLRARLIERLGLVREAELEPRYRPEWPTILAGAEAAGHPPAARRMLAQAAEWLQHGVIERALERASAARPFSGPGASSGLGSNSWVVSGERSATGKPLLANDMHLSLGAPAIWFENHLQGGGLNVAGVSFPGIPGVIAGHNSRVAWGFTNGFADVQDLYIEHLRREVDDSVTYEFRGERREARVHRETIRVKDNAPETVEVVETLHGPVISHLANELAGGQALALRWTAFEPTNAVRAMLALSRAGDCREVQAALRDWSAPVQNVVFADTGGNIGYTLAGKVPRRARGDGSVPVPGWTGVYEWEGCVPADELPALFNPPNGYVVTANNRITLEEYRYPLGSEFCSGARAERIVEMIQAAPKLSVADVQRMQFDQVSTLARSIAGILAGLDGGDARLSAALDRLRGWDGDLGAGSPAAGLYQVFVRQLLYRLLPPRLGELAPNYTGKGPLPELAEASLFGEKAIGWLLNVLEDPNSDWYAAAGDGAHPGRDAVLREALAEAVYTLSRRLGPRPEDWAWGRLHTQTFSHVMGVSPGTAAFFNRGPFPVGGDGTTVWSTIGSVAPGEWDVRVGPPFRFIADLSDLDHCLGLLAPGNSGHPSSPHYDDQVQAWFEGGYHRMAFARQDVERETEERLDLLPA